MMMQLCLATSPFARMRGLLGGRNEASLLIAPCRRIHTIGMRFAIDVAFIAPDGEVLRAIRGLRPGCLSRSCRKAAAVLERRADDSPWLLPGQRLELKSSDQERSER
ncbi:MAG: DUF192 domain-containing protein [Actinomycetia bacterium]|nr:DUF192 domain-containing protein [Actinomycetes bacterium]